MREFDLVTFEKFFHQRAEPMGPAPDRARRNFDPVEPEDLRDSVARQSILGVQHRYHHDDLVWKMQPMERRGYPFVELLAA